MTEEHGASAMRVHTHSHRIQVKRLAARASIAPMIEDDARFKLAIEDLVDHAMRDAVLLLPVNLAVAVAGRPLADPQ